MTSSSTDRRLGLTGGTAFKAPVLLATTAAITLSGEQSIDGVTTASSRVLVMNQADATTNGIYNSDTGAWTRALDFDGINDAVQGTLVYVAQGSTNAGLVYQLTTVNPVIGSSSLSFSVGLFGGLGNTTFLQAGTGAVSQSAQNYVRSLPRSVLAFMTTAEQTAYLTNTYSGSVTNVTAAVQAAITAGNVFFPDGTARLSSSLTGISNRILNGTGTIDVASMYGNGKIAAINLDGVSVFTVDGLTFHSNGLNDREAGIFLKDTTTPCSDITIKNCTFNNIKGITTWDGSGNPGGLFPAHIASSGYPSLYYQTDSHLHRRITFTDNTLVNLTAGSDTNGYGAWLWYCRDVVIARNKVKDLFAVAMLRGGDPNSSNWVASAQASYNNVVSGNVSDIQDSGIVLIGVRNTVVYGNTIIAASGSAEILDSEGGRDNLFDANTIIGGQSPLNTFYTNNDVVFSNNVIKATVYSGGAGGVGIYRGSMNSTDADVANSGLIILRGNKMVSTVGEANVFVGYCKEMVIEGNEFLNVTIYSASGTNLLTVKDNTLDFTISPTLKNIIQVGAGNTALWNTGYSSPTPRIQIKDNIVNGMLAAGVSADAIYITPFTQAGSVDITGNRLDNTGGNGVHLAASGGIARTINIVNNVIRNDGSTVPFLADASIASDVVYWDNNRTFNGRDTMGAITGTPATNLTVDAKAITANGSRIISSGSFAAGQPVGWVYDLATTTWVRFGITY